MTLVHEIEHALWNKLPTDLHDRVPHLAQVLADVTNGTLAKETAQKRLKDANLEPLLHDLAGQQVQVDHALLSFGQGSHMGDVTIGDVAGGNITKLSLRGDIVMGNKVLTFGLGIGAALVLAIGLIVAFGGPGFAQIGVNMLPTATPAPTPTAFAAANGDESLIIVADFEDRSAGEHTGIDPDQYIYEELRGLVAHDDLPIRVERLYETLNDRTASRTGEVYDATLVIWGWYDRLTISPRFERSARLESTHQIEAGQRINFSGPEQIEMGVTRDLPAMTNYLAFYIIGNDRLARGELDDAREYFASALASLPEDGSAPLPENEILFLRGFHALLGDEYKQAIAYYNDAIALDPEDALTYANRGFAYAEQGEYGRAIEDYERLLELSDDPDLRAAAERMLEDLRNE